MDLTMLLLRAESILLALSCLASIPIRPCTPSRPLRLHTAHGTVTFGASSYGLQNYYQVRPGPVVSCNGLAAYCIICSTAMRQAHLAERTKFSLLSIAWALSA
mmetsp:Transcript_3187/g.9706  ORF Transcript_3187/g.9706 Transcript_3187/m.9706 type:complete len:103 (+) Transcript_3187:1413-1721(+)